MTKGSGHIERFPADRQEDSGLEKVSQEPDRMRYGDLCEPYSHLLTDSATQEPEAPTSHLDIT